MFNLNFITVLNLFSIILATRVRNNSFEPYSRFTKILCSSSNVTISEFKCFIKAYSQKNTTLNISVNISRPIFDVKAQYNFGSRSLSNSQRSMINVTIDFCEVLNGTGTNPVFNWLIGMVSELKILHPCPYKVCMIL
ncbi:hypothetical protein ACKWTF_014344 [Chironomus riparius]